MMSNSNSLFRNDAWLSGAVHPITCRGLVGMLLAALPKETLGTLGLLFATASCDDCEDGTPRLLESLESLQESNKPGLDDYVDEPIVSINPAASARQITTAIGELLKDWKSERDLSEGRDRSDKYPMYLEVWDRREGWTGRDYAPLSERTFKEIAKSVGETPSTVSNHYHQAFKLITGHAYRPALWYRIMMWHKFGLLGFEDSPVSRRRPSTSPTPAPIPESQLGADLEVVRAATNPTDHSPFQELDDLTIDIRSLIEQGKSDQEIMESLGMNDNEDSRRLIGYSRRRDDL